MEIKTIDDWHEVELELNRQYRGVGYNPDLNKMRFNLNAMIRELSKSTVEARRTHGQKYLQPQIDEINRAIQSFEHWVLILLLER